MRPLALPALFLLLTGCSAEWAAVDADGDGVPFGLDCNDLDAGVGDQPEIWYDGIDQDCDGNDADQDGDGYVPDFYVADFPDAWQNFPAHIAAGDCWDDPVDVPSEYQTVPTLAQIPANEVNPGKTDTWYDGTDQDCGGNSDFDQDGDGVDSAHALGVDGQPAGDDCADQESEVALNVQNTCAHDPVTVGPELIFPGATDPVYDGLDQDCAGDDDFDGDGDGFPRCEECDDTEPTIYPSDQPEVWYDGVDDNCDGNDGDKDGDGYVDAAYVLAFPDSWDDPAYTAHRTEVRDADGAVVEGLDPFDCWDNGASTPTEFTPLNGYGALNPEEVYPRAKSDEPLDQPYDGIDADCWADSDFDADLDGYDSDTVPQRDGSVGLDCDDAADDVNPDGDDICGDGIDSDCDGQEIIPTSDDPDDSNCENYYLDDDQDGWGGTDGGFVCQCAPNPATEYTETTNTDCDDDDATMYPGAADVCDGQDNDCDGSLESTEVDNDGDGYVECSEDAGGWDGSSEPDYDDCDDTDSTVHPTAADVCDGQDNDCDGSLEASEIDNDGDGYVECSEDSGGWDGSSEPSYDDCDDGEATTYPGATEQIADGVDNDCDGVETCYLDADKDGFGDTDTSNTIETGAADFDCTRTWKTYADNADDCDDSDKTVNPDADEVCDGQDNDCDSSIPADEQDNDSDGYVECTLDSGGWDGSGTMLGDDCDDALASVYPGATESVADGVDQDCDSVDSCYQDLDRDGQGSSTVVDGPDLDCDQASSQVADDQSDCDDSDDTVYTGAAELCDGQLNECSGSGVPSDETDDDSDGYVECSDDGSTWVGSAISGYDDCDDGDSGRSPGLTEVCDSADKDEDCDGLSDDSDSSTDSSTKTRYYTDSDSDGYGDEDDSGTLYCDAPSGVTTDNTDCDDSSTSINPGGSEVTADGIDQNCDDVDECYVDDDGDGYGSSSTTDGLNLNCDRPGVGLANDSNDCDDTDGDTFPGAAPSDSTSACMKDTDGDDYGDASVSGSVAVGTDCDDDTYAINPDATEVCDADDTDEDCNGVADDDDSGVTGTSTWFVDSDSDGYGDAADAGTEYCDPPSAYVSDNSDCLDSDGDTFPGAAAIDSTTDCMTDADGDDYGDDSPVSGVTDGTDCDDSDASVNPSVDEDGTPALRQDGTDDDCSGSDAPYLLEDLAEGDLVVTELNVNPTGGDDPNMEFVEILNNSGGELDFQGLYWTNSGGNSATLADSVVIADGDYFVWGASDDTGTNGGYTPDAVYEFGTGTGKISLLNTADTVSFYADDQTTLLDEVAYDTAAYFPDFTNGGAANGKSLNLDPGYESSSDNDYGGHWCVSSTLMTTDYGTPGVSNDSCGFTYSFATDIAPLFSSDCSTCHTTGSLGGLTGITTWDNLVSVASVDFPSTYELVTPFDSANSYIYMKVIGDAAIDGNQMPNGGPYLSTADEQMIADWIDEGAPQ